MGLSKYLDLKYRLQKEIADKKWRAHEMIPSEAELCERYAVSADTVRKALLEMSEEGLIYRLPRRGTFVSPEVRRQQLLIVIADPSLRNPFDSWHMEFFAGVMGGVRARHPSILPFLVDEKTFLSSLSDLELVYRDLSGVIFFRRPQTFASSWKQLAEKEIPAVFFGSDTYLKEVGEGNSFLYSEEKITACALDYLYDQGVREFGVFYPLVHPTLKNRFEHFDAWIRAKGLKVSPESICAVPVSGDFDDASYRKRLLEKPLAAFAEKNAGVFCTSDAFAIYLIHEALRSGYGIPKDFRVVGVDNLSVGELDIVPLTSVKMELEADGTRCLDLFVELMTGQIRRIREEGRIRIVGREST